MRWVIGFVLLATTAVVPAQAAAPDGRFVPLPAPARPVDVSMAPHATLTSKLAGRSGIPATGVETVAAHVSVGSATAPGSLSAGPAVVHFDPSAPWHTEHTMLPAGDITFRNNSAGTLRLVVFVTGYYVAAAHPDGLRFVPLPHSRIFDASVPANQTATFDAAPGRSTGAVLVNVTAVTPAADGAWRLYPAGGSPRLAHGFFQAGHSATKSAITTLSADGRLTLENLSGGAARYVVEVSGYYTIPTSTVVASRVVPLTPTRVLDRARVPVGSTIEVAPAVPAGVSAVAVVLTAQRATARGVLIAYPTGSTRPVASDLQYPPSDWASNLVWVPAGRFSIYNGGGPVDIQVDLVGYAVADRRPEVPVDENVFRYYDQSSNFGRGVSGSREGGSLGWGEWTHVEGYANQYDATGDPAWLDKLVDHGDRMIGNARDHDGDGTLGWPDLRYAHNQVENPDFAVEHSASANLVSNGGFEAGTSSPSGWQGTGRRSTSPIDVYDGAAGAVVSSDGLTENRLVQQIQTVAGKRYLVDAFAGIDSGATQARVEVVAAGKVLRFVRVHHAGFEQQVFEFTAPGPVQIRLGLESYARPGWRARFDAVSVRALPDQPTLGDAAAWYRVNSPLSAVHRTVEPAAIELIADGNNEPQISQRLNNYRPGREYAFSAVVRGAPAMLRVVDESDAGRVLGTSEFAGTGFVYFRTPAAEHSLRLDILLPRDGGARTASAYDVFAGELWEQLIHHGTPVAPLLRFVNTVYDDPLLWSRYRSKADVYVHFVAGNLVHKWEPYWRQISPTTGVYASPLGFSTEWFPGRSLPPNQYLGYARVLYLLYDAVEHVPEYADRRNFYLTRANDMNRAFKANLHPHELDPNAYLWNYWEPEGEWDVGHYYPTRLSDGRMVGEDLSHASLTMLGVHETYRHGQVWTLADMRRFTRTLVDVMWNGSLTDPVLTSYNHGRYPYPERTPLLNTWVGFAEFDPRVVALGNAIEEAYGIGLRYGLHPLGQGLLASFGGNRVVNPQFEWELSPYWQRLWPQTGTVVREKGHTTLGQWGLTINGTGAPTGIEQTLREYEPGAPYSILLRGSGAVAEVYDYTTGTSLGSVTQSGIVRMPVEADHDIRVRVHSAGTAYVEEVRAQPLDVSNEAPGAFEIASKTDRTLPRHWQRATGSVVVLDPVVRHAGSRSVKVTTGSISYTWRGYRPDDDYAIKAFATGGSGTITLRDGSQQLARLDLAGGAGWSAYEGAFRTPATHDRTLVVEITGTGIWVDDLVVSSR